MVLQAGNAFIYSDKIVIEYPKETFKITENLDRILYGERDKELYADGACYSNVVSLTFDF